MSHANNSLQALRQLGQSVWYDNMYRALIGSGELQRLIDSGVTGLTSNPTIFEKAVSSGDDYDDSLIAYAKDGLTPEDAFEALAIEDIQAAADLLRPVYEDTGGADGFASLEVNPHLAHNTEGTIAAAERLFSALGRPNAMIKVPATPEGIPAIRHLIGQGININVTLIFSLDMYARVRDAYVAGLEDLVHSGGDPATVSSVASFFVSRVDTAIDGLLQNSGRGRLPPSRQGGGRQCQNRLPGLQGDLRNLAIPGPVCQRRASTTSALGIHQHQEPRVQRRHVRRNADRPGHGEHHARRDTSRLPGAWDGA